jgi:hypothetical protein
MAVQKTQSSNASTPAYHVDDPHGNSLVLRKQPNSSNVTLGGAANFVVLSRQNVTDLLVALTVFSNTGTLS